MSIEQHCTLCGEEIEPMRVLLLKKQERQIICLFCGEEQARQDRKLWCIAPMHKSNYMLFTNREDLAGINQKGGVVK
jgi:hypothetical protein